MNPHAYSVQEKTRFSESLIWQLNTDFYKEKGIAAWSEGIVPHQITNSALAATAYAELIYAFLKDLEMQKKADEVVYILELGAGHGRLCFNILKHLDVLIAASPCSTKYCYVLSDIVEDNLSFLSSHLKLQTYYDREVLDLCYFDATTSEKLSLRKSNATIATEDLEQAILTIANYFFDSLPNELYYIHNNEIYDCLVSIDASVDPEKSSAQELISNMNLEFHNSIASVPIFENTIWNEILAQYMLVKKESYILFPRAALDCLRKISSLSKTGLVVLTMDKGYKEIHSVTGRICPDIVKHGSFSIWVNFHALSQFCIQSGGHAMFDASTNLSIEFGALFFTNKAVPFPLVEKMYRKHSSQINLDDLNSMKQIVYKNIGNVDLSQLLGFIRLSAYDSSIFIKLLPRIKNLVKQISVMQRDRLKQTLRKVWDSYYAVKEDYDLSYELGGLMYDLGFYKEAMEYFDCSLEIFGNKIDVDYNQILCHFQLRQDALFYQKLKAAKLRFPQSDMFANLELLDMDSK